MYDDTAAQQEKDNPNTEVTETAEVVMPHLLLGMTLANTQKQFLFVDEWRHVADQPGAAYV